MGLHAITVGIRALVLIPLSILVLACLATVLLFLGGSEQFINGSMARVWARFVVWLAAADVRVRGADNIPVDGGPHIVVMNHQSNMDIPVLVHALPLQLRFMGKIELRKIPVFGSALLKAGHYLIDRKDRQHALAGIRAAAEAMREKKTSVVFAPEGTRSPDGRIQSFKKGAFVAAIETGFPLLPVTIDGTRHSLPKGSLWARAADVTVTIHPPIATSGLRYEDRDGLSEKVRGIMEETLKWKIDP